MTTQFSVLRTDGTGATAAFAGLASFRTGPSAVCRWTRGLGRRSTFRVGLARVDGRRWTISDEHTPGVFRERLRTCSGTSDGTRDQTMVGLIEKPLLRAVIRETKGNQVRAAQLLGINRNTLREKLKEHGIVPGVV